jgi:hypothetical protein
MCFYTSNSFSLLPPSLPASERFGLVARARHGVAPPGREGAVVLRHFYTLAKESGAIGNDDGRFQLFRVRFVFCVCLLTLPIYRVFELRVHLCHRREGLICASVSP